MEAIQEQIDPGKILQVGMGFFSSKTLLTAVNMELFTRLGDSSLSGEQLISVLGLNNRSAYDFLDSLVALGFLKRDGLKESSVYRNSDDSRIFLDKNKRSYMGGILEMSNNRLYPFWANLEDGLKTGLPQNETKTGDKPLFEELYSNEDRLKEFVHAMGGIQFGNFMAFAEKFDFSNYATLTDVGGAGAHLSIRVASKQQHMKCTSFDLGKVTEIAANNVKMMGLDSCIATKAGDFFQDQIPAADVITMGNVLHDWGLEKKKFLIKKAYDALPKGGALVVIENIIDNDRKENVFGLMMSLNMLIDTDEGFDFSFADFDGWVTEIGFQRTEIMHLTGPTSAAIAYK